MVCEDFFEYWLESGGLGVGEIDDEDNLCNSWWITVTIITLSVATSILVADSCRRVIGFERSQVHGVVGATWL